LAVEVVVVAAVFVVPEQLEKISAKSAIAGSKRERFTR